jgi:hypothetical protein
MDIKDSVRKYFKLQPPGNSNDHNPSTDELLSMWEEFRKEASEIGYEFSSHLPSLKKTPEINVVKKIIKICQELFLFAGANLEHTKEVVDSITYLDKLEEGPEVFIGDILSIFGGGNTARSQIQAKRQSELKKFDKTGNKLKRQFDAFELEYFNIAYEAERVFFKTFRGKPID